VRLLALYVKLNWFFPKKTQVNAFAERYFRSNGEISRCQLAQFDTEEEFWEDAREHGNFLYNRLPLFCIASNEPWLSPRQHQYPEQKVIDLTKKQHSILSAGLI
jgi:hypothetical protein